jgi:hypothetical protein
MRAVVALAVVLLVLVGLTIRVATHKTKRPPPVEPEETDVEPVAPRRTVPPERWSLGPAPREHAGVAHINGRATLPADEGDSDLSDLSVVADDGARTFSARVSDGGRFAFHLPAGRYTLTASAGDLVGAVFDVVVHGGSERTVDIPLGAGAKISGAVRAPEDAAISVKATVAGEAGEAGAGDASDGAFEVAGLVPGRRYDLTFSGPTVRTATLRGVLAPAADQDVIVDALAVIRGAIGFPRGERCPIEEVKLETASARKPSSDDDDDGLTAHPGTDCRFELSVPENVSEATVTATGTGWFLEQRVEIPARGDPEPVCLNPPCRDDPTEGLATLRVSLEGGDDGPMTAEVTFVDDEGSGGSSSCNSSRGACRLEQLPVGQQLKLDGYSAGCRAEPRTITLPAGETSLALPCHRQRRVEGVVRISDGVLLETMTVRCAGGGMHRFHRSRLFALTCAADDADLEYQTEHGGPWQSVAIPPADDPAFVEIGL